MRNRPESVRVRMTRIESLHDNLRTSTVEGFLYRPVEVGQEIMITAQPLDESFDVRCVTTTRVERIEGDLYFTRNSTYRIEVLEDEVRQLGS